MRCHGCENTAYCFPNTLTFVGSHSSDNNADSCEHADDPRKEIQKVTSAYPHGQNDIRYPSETSRTQTGFIEGSVPVLDVDICDEGERDELEYGWKQSALRAKTRAMITHSAGPPDPPPPAKSASASNAY